MLNDVRGVIALLSAVHHGRSTRATPEEYDRLAKLAGKHDLLSFHIRVLGGGKPHILSPIGLTKTGERLVAAHNDGTWGKALNNLLTRGEAVTLERMILAVRVRDAG